jgi:hypothetical protein
LVHLYLFFEIFCVKLCLFQMFFCILHKLLLEYAQALAQLVGSGIMKPEEAREVLKSAMPSFAQIVEQLKEDTDAYSPDKNWNDYS